MSRTLDERAVRHVARLARLSLSDEDVARFAAQLSDVLDYMEKLAELDTTDVPPTAHPLSISNVFRDDRVGSSLSADDALHNAPDRQDGFFRVPKVLDQDSA